MVVIMWITRVEYVVDHVDQTLFRTKRLIFRIKFDVNLVDCRL